MPVDEETVPVEMEQLLDSVELKSVPAEISFSNGAAVRVGLIVAAISMALLVPLANLGGMSLLGIIVPTLSAGGFLPSTRRWMGLRSSCRAGLTSPIGRPAWWLEVEL